MSEFHTPAVLQRPDPDALSPERAPAVLRRLGLLWAAEPGFLPEPLPSVVRSFEGEWWVGQDVTVGYTGRPEDFPAVGDWTCQCQLRVPARCAHVACAVVVHAWNNPRLRPLFDQPAWALDLEKLLSDDDDASARKVPHEGWIRYRLRARTGVELVEREVSRRSKRDGRELLPQQVPPDLSELEDRVDGLRAVDHTLHDLLAAWRTARIAGRLDNDAASLARRLGDRAFDALLSVRDLWFEERPLRPRRDALVPVLVATDGKDGIHLSWKTAVRHVFRRGPGYAVTHDGELRPLEAKGIDPEVLVGELPAVAPEEAERFLEQFVLHSRVPVELASRHLPPTLRPDHLEAQITLAEEHDEDEGLLVGLRFAYTVGDVTETVADGHPATVLRVGDALVTRRAARESRLRHALEAALGRPVPARLHGEEALEFLAGGMPTGGEWAVYGADQLTRHRLRGRLDAHVHVPSGIDWFDLELRFEVNGVAVDGEAVLKSFLAGQRFHRLPDGTIAQLPERWLERHGRAAAELLEIKRATGGPLSLYAAPLVASLFDEEQQVAALARWGSAVSQLVQVGRVPERPLPSGFEGELRHYQHDGFRWLCFLRDGGLGGVLADDMGLGKTIQAIVTLLDTHASDPDGPPSLIVCPTSVVYNWAAELARFAPGLRVLVHHGPERGGVALEQHDVVVTTYALLRLDAELLSGRPWRYAILDEAQHIKNPASQLAAVARGLDAKHRLALTGTPLENHLLELWSIFEFLMPGFFGRRAAFRRRYVLPIQNEKDPQAMAALRRRLRPFVLRRLKSEVATELPSRTELILYCELSDAQRALYEQVKGTYRAQVMTKVDQKGVRGATFTVLEALTRLRQACCDPGLLPYPEAQEVEESAKLDLLLETLDELEDAGHRTLVFSQWPSLLKRVVPHIEERGWSYLYLDGSTTERQALVERWNAPDGPPVFLISLKAGGAGLNLVGAEHVVHLDPWWNPAVEDQATDRAHRIGQTKPVVAYKLVARGTVEEKVLELQARKRALFEATMDAERTVVDQLTRADLEAVFAPTEA